MGGTERDGSNWMTKIVRGLGKGKKKEKRDSNHDATYLMLHRKRFCHQLVPDLVRRQGQATWWQVQSKLGVGEEKNTVFRVSWWWWL